jgi:hypothetical protein
LGPTAYAGKTDSRDAISLFSNAPLLTQVALSATFGPFETQLPWSQLTSISAYSLTASECAEILQDSAALRELHCNRLEFDPGNLLPVAPLRYLHSLNLGGGSGHQQLLKILTTPALQHLTIPDTLNTVIPDITALILRSHCTLESLHIVYTDKEDVTYRAAFPSIPTITATGGRLSSL